MIKVGDIVKHTLSLLYFRCENKKQEKWMNESGFYTVANGVVLPPNYFAKTT